MDSINGYLPLKPFTTAGAGTASWTIARKGGEEYFLKRFNSPKFTASCMEYCRKYEEKKRALYRAIRSLNNGNLVVIEDFFHSNTYYYIATKRVHESSVTAETVHGLPREMQLVIMKTLAHCMMQLEQGGIVHADLKPSNVMLKPTVGGFYSLKLIDFDSSFFVSDPPAESDDMEGDATYLSPEMLMGMCGEKVELSSKLDVFAAGIMFHQFLSGELPKFDSDFDSLCEAVANGGEIELHEDVPAGYRELILAMLEAQPGRRPTFGDVFRTLGGLPVPEPVRRKEPGETVSKCAQAAKQNPWMKKAGRL